MSQYKPLFFFLFIILSFNWGGRVEDSINNNRIFFSLKPEYVHMVFPVYLNDSISANMTLDTGSRDGAFLIDSTFIDQHLASFPYFTDDNVSNVFRVGSGWGTNSVRNLVFNINQKVKLGNTELNYNRIQVSDWKGAMYDPLTEGVFNIPENDTTHIWEFNFENNYLEIHSVEDFKFPQNSFFVALEKEVYYDTISWSFIVKLPIFIESSDGDTITMNCKFFIDTGMHWDIALFSHAEEWNFFNSKDDALWTRRTGNTYDRRHTVKATLFDEIIIDSLYIHVFNEDHALKMNLIGLNFLKHFNVFFDMKDLQMALQPITNFQRLSRPNIRRFHYLAHSIDDGRFVVSFVPDYPKNYYKTAGLHVGDEIIRINNIQYKDITPEITSDYYKMDTLYFDIIRDGIPIKLNIPVDKNEVQGD